MALEHALLVSLSERAGSGLDLTRRFDKSIGFFWSATHQQIYRVLSRMELSGWVLGKQVRQLGRADKKVYEVTPAGLAEVARWLDEPLKRENHRSDLAVKLRAASLGDRSALLAQVATLRAEHATRLAYFESDEARNYPDPGRLSRSELDRYLVLRGGIHSERFMVEWLGEYLDTHTAIDSSPRPVHHFEGSPS